MRDDNGGILGLAGSFAEGFVLGYGATKLAQKVQDASAQRKAAQQQQRQQEPKKKPELRVPPPSGIKPKPISSDSPTMRAMERQQQQDTKPATTTAPGRVQNNGYKSSRGPAIKGECRRYMDSCENSGNGNRPRPKNSFLTDEEMQGFL
jgi:hypothetical protein